MISSISSLCRQPPAQQKTYLERSVELLSNGRSHRLKEIAWKTAAIASVLLFTALAVGLTVTVGITGQYWVPFLCLAFLQPIYSIYSKLNQLSQEHGMLYRQIVKTRSLIAHLPKENGPFWTLLANEGITPPADVSQLRPVAGEYFYWKGVMEQINKEKGDIDQEMVELAAPERAKELDHARAVSYFTGENGLSAKVRAAWALAMLQNPTHLGSMDQSVAFVELSLAHRELHRNFKDPRADAFLIKNGHYISRQEIGATPLAELSRRLIA